MRVFSDGKSRLEAPEGRGGFFRRKKQVPRHSGMAEDGEDGVVEEEARREDYE